jgi:3-oxoacyl-[acyl-carrier-protein] synthase-3
LIYSRIAGTGSFLPANVTNADLARWSTRAIVGRRTRRHTQRHLAAKAKPPVTWRSVPPGALETAGVASEERPAHRRHDARPDLSVDRLPAADRLGANGCPAFDVNAACSAIYALTVADKFIRSGSEDGPCRRRGNASRMIDWSNRSTCVLFGDGAGAVVLKASEEAGILRHIHADGAYKELL